MLSIRLKPEVESKLRDLSKSTDKSMAFFINKALEDRLEDFEDIYAALSVLEKTKPSDYISEDDAWRELGV